MNPLRQKIIQKGVESLLREAKVPQRIHLQVVEQLAKSLKAHRAEMAAHEETVARHKNQLDSSDKIMRQHQNQLDQWDSAIKEFLGKDWTGPQGETPVEGVHYRRPKDGVSPDVHEVARIAASLIKLPEIPETVEVPELDKEALYKEFVARIQKERVIDVSHIRNAESFLFNGKKIKFEELMHGAGSSTGGSFAVQVPNGVVNGINQVFVFTTAPSVIVLDNGNFMNKVSADGTVNWTGTTTVTLNQAPNFNIYGF